MLNLATASRAREWGLDTERARAINSLLQDYPGGRLSLRRVPTSDPAFDPTKPFGVYEEGAEGRPWVFFVAEMSLDARILARIAESDFAKYDANAQWDRFQALQDAEAALVQRQRDEIMAERREQAEFLARTIDKGSTRLVDSNGNRVASDGYGNFRRTTTRL